MRTVGDMGELPDELPVFALPEVPLTLETLRIILPYSLTMAAVGLLESLMTAQIVDEMTDTPATRTANAGQGIANIVTGLFGGMAGCAMIGQSVINVKSGGRGRLSTFVAGASCSSCSSCSGDWVAPDPDGGPGRGDDHGLDRHLLLALDPRICARIRGSSRS